MCNKKCTYLTHTAAGWEKIMEELEQKMGKNNYFRWQHKTPLTIELFVQLMNKSGAGLGGRKTFSE